MNVAMKIFVEIHKPILPAIVLVVLLALALS